MSERKKSRLSLLGLGLLGDALVFIAALILFALFAMSSFTKAYIIAFTALAVLLLATVFYKRTKKRRSAGMNS